MCGTGLPVPLQGTRGGTSQDMTWYVDLIGSFEMVNMRMWLLVTKDQNSKFPIDRSFSELLTSKLVLELPSYVASFSLCRRRRKPEVHGGFQVTGTESATRSDKGSTFEPTFKDGDHSTCQASAGSTCHGAFVWSSWKAAADDGRFCGWFPGKIAFLIGNCRELDHVLIFSGRLGCLGVAKPCTNCRIAAITQWCHGCRGRPNKSQSQGLKHWIDINVLYTFIYMCGKGLPVPLQGTRGGTSQDMTW